MSRSRADSERVPSPPPGADDPDDDVVPPVPPDGGWGWIIVAGSLLCNVIVDGVCFSFGIFYPEFLNYFQESRGKTAFVGSLIPGMYLGMGPISSALANRFGCRKVTIAGAVMACASFFASTFSPNVDVLIFTYGILGGFGFGLMYLPAIVIVGFYFDKKRAFATGIAVCGSGIGTFLFAPFGRYLLDNFGWKGSYWIISGIILNGAVCGALFRPLEAVPVKRLKPRQLRQLRETPRGMIIERIIEEKKRNRTISTGSLDGCIITRDNMLIKDPEKITKVKNMTLDRLSRLVEVEEEEEQGQIAPKMPNRILQGLKNEDRAFRPPAPLPFGSSHTTESEKETTSNQRLDKIPVDASKIQMKNLGGDTKEALSVNQEDSNAFTKSLTIISEPDDVPRGRAFSESRKTNPSFRVSRVGVKVNYAPQQTMGSARSLKSSASKQSIDQKAKDASRPMNRKDIFYTGSVTSLREYKVNPDMASYIASHTSIAPATTEEAKSPSVLKKMLDLSLMKSPTFLLLCGTSVFAMTGFFTPFVYMTDNALKMGVPKMQATLLLSVLGGANTLGRVTCGFISDRPWADCLMIHNLALVIAGTATCFVPLLTNFPLLVLYCVIFGMCIAAFITLRSIVLVELLGLEKLTSSFGLLLAFQGVASLIGSPIAGAIFDKTKSYTYSFVVAGALIAAAGLMALPVRRVAAWESRKWGPLVGEQRYTRVAEEDGDTAT